MRNSRSPFSIMTMSLVSHQGFMGVNGCHRYWRSHEMRSLVGGWGGGRDGGTSLLMPHIMEAGSAGGQLMFGRRTQESLPEGLPQASSQEAQIEEMIEHQLRRRGVVMHSVL